MTTDQIARRYADVMTNGIIYPHLDVTGISDVETIANLWMVPHRGLRVYHAVTATTHYIWGPNNTQWEPVE